VWYFVIFGITEPVEYEGGYYMGVIKCPPEYPAKAPSIRLFTDNGRFVTT
jgi:ubiquitin-conjugating enzyme E2 J2